MKTNNGILKNGQELNVNFTEEDKQLANAFMKYCSTSLVTREV